MARHFKNGIAYFNIDCIQEDSLQFIKAKHGISGYGVLIELWRKIYMIDGYYCEWNEKNIYLFAKECGVDVAFINEVIETCFQEGIFSGVLFKNSGVLTGKGVQKRWLKIVTEAKRKNCKILPEYCLLDKTPEELAKTQEELVKTPEVIPQSKVKESKVKESKEENTVAPASPVPPSAVDKKPTTKKKQEEPPEPYWAELVKVWFEFGKEKFGTEPSFAGQDPKILKRIVHLMKRRVEKKGKTWDKDNAISSMNWFLASAFQDSWLSKHFLLKNLEQQFDAVIQQQQKKVEEKKKEVAPLKEKGLNADLSYLIGRYQEGADILPLINEVLYGTMESRELLPVGYYRQMQGVDVLEQKKNAVLQFIKHNAKQESHAA